MKRFSYGERDYLTFGYMLPYFTYGITNYDPASYPKSSRRRHDYSATIRWKHVASWAGVCPGNHESELFCEVK
jgi:hypothetical protein